MKRSPLLVALAIWAVLPALALAQKTDEPTRIYLAPDDHTDYVWSGDEETYRKAFLEMLDYYLDLADKTQSQPAEFQSRWNCDGSFWLWVYERSKPKADFERLIGRMRSGHVSVPLNPLVCCYGGAPVEAVLRGMYYPGQIERKYGLRFPLAIAMENQTHPYGLVALWAGSGAKYSWKGVCNCATRIPRSGDRESPVYWLAGPDGSRVLMKWYPSRDNQSLGGYAEARHPEQAVRIAETEPWFTRRYPYKVIGLFGKGWDDLKTQTDEFVVVARKLSQPGRRVIVSNEVDFFADFEKSYGAKLPREACSYGNEWDLLCASMAEVSAGVKRSVERLRGAEAVATLVALKQPDFMGRRTQARDQTWMDLGLYWEHCWTADGRVPRKARADWQRRVASRIQQYVDRLYVDAVAALGGMIGRGGDHVRFFAFNPLSWQRTDTADFPYADRGAVHVVDLSSGKEAPSQIITINEKRYLRVLAENVPPVGYKVFEVRPGPGKEFPAAAQVAGRSMENEFYRLELADRGAIVSLFDKQRKRELAQVIADRSINDLGPGRGVVRVEDAGPVSVTLVARGDRPLAHTTRVTLLRGSRRIEIRNLIEQNFADVRTIDFAFNLDKPDVWHEECGAIIRAKLLERGGHYSPRNARYDWLTLNHFADLSSGGAGVTLSNADCYFMQLGHSTTESLDEKTPLVRALVGGQVDGPSLGIPNQDGDKHFMQRFALQTHAGFDPAAAMRFALEHQNRLITGPVALGAVAKQGQYPADQFSLLRLSSPEVLVWAVKPAEEGIDKGMIVRMWNVANHPNECALRLWRPFTAAQRTTHIETDLGPAAVEQGGLQASFTAQQMQTFRVMVFAGEK